MGAIRIKNKRKGEAAARGLLKKRKRSEADVELGIEGAGKRLERMEKEIAAQGKVIAGLTVTVGKLWKEKIEREMK